MRLRGGKAVAILIAARALGRIGPDARPAIAFLEVLKRDKSREVRRAARLALARLRPLP